MLDLLNGVNNYGVNNYAINVRKSDIKHLMGLIKKEFNSSNAELDISKIYKIFNIFIKEGDDSYWFYVKNYDDGYKTFGWDRSHIDPFINYKYKKFIRLDSEKILREYKLKEL